MYSIGGSLLQEFNIAIHSISDVRDFVEIATVQPFQVTVGNGNQAVNGKSFIGMFSLNFRNPLTVSAECSDEEFRTFRDAVAQLWA